MSWAAWETGEKKRIVHQCEMQPIIREWGTPSMYWSVWFVETKCGRILPVNPGSANPRSWSSGKGIPVGYDGWDKNAEWFQVHASEYRMCPDCLI